MRRSCAVAARCDAWYDESHVLHGVDFDVRAGEVVTLLGRNGAGKTTTLKSVMGIVPKRRGSVRFRDDELIARPSNAIARLGLAFCPEERGIFASLTVEENLLLPPVVQPGGLGTEAIFALFPNLRERGRSQGTKLSGGEQQMLAIGRILRTGARLLLLDEPTEGLAPVIVQPDRGHHPPPEGRGLHDPARRAELPLRLHGGRSPLRDGARAGGGHDPATPSSRRTPPSSTSTSGYNRPSHVVLNRTKGPTHAQVLDCRHHGRDRPRRPARGPGPDLRRGHQDRRAHRHVEPLRRPLRPGLGDRGPHGGGGLRRRQEGDEGRDRLRPTTRTRPTSGPASRGSGSTPTRWT